MLLKFRLPPRASPAGPPTNPSSLSDPVILISGQSMSLTHQLMLRGHVISLLRLSWTWPPSCILYAPINEKKKRKQKELLIPSKGPFGFGLCDSLEGHLAFMGEDAQSLRCCSPPPPSVPELVSGDMGREV